MNFSILQKPFLLILFVMLAFSFAGPKAYGQIGDIENSYARYNEYNLQEKIYVHTDRSFYLCGDILWFKTYLTNAVNNQPLSLSKVVYIEVLNKLHQPILQGKIGMKNGLGNGSFFLPFSIVSGNYELRAYTNWMKNFSPDHYFSKNISIINTSRNLDTADIHPSVNYNAAFFPEGGNLVNGLESEIAFKVTDNNNKGVDCEGTVIDQANNTITNFKTFHSGIGHFYLNPENGKKYTAIVNCRDGSVIRKELPVAYSAGYVMHVSDTNANDLKISIAFKGENTSEDVYIIIQNNRRINIARSQRIENSQGILIISKDSLKDGVTQITLFDTNKQPQCERLYFKRPKNKMILRANADAKIYQLRSKISINISAADALGNSLAGNLSTSVFRLDGLHQPDQENIFSYLWLSSSLQGFVEDPGYYLNNENAETNEALDNLLLAQGWRKFNWKNILSNKKPAFTYVPEYSGHIITGKITDATTKQPAENIVAYLSVPGRRVQLKGCGSDSAGLIHFDMKDFIGSNQIVLQTNTGVDSGFHLEIFSPFSEEFTDASLPAFHASESESNYLQQGNFHMQVENGYHEQDLQKLQKPLVDTLPFYTKPFKTYLLDNYTRFTTMEEVMREYVDEVAVRRKGQDYRLMSINEPAFALQSKQPVEVMFQTDPLVLLDGVPVFNTNKVIAYDPLKVEKLEVVASKYDWGPIRAYGIASYTTYKGNLEGYTLDPNDLVLDYDALQQQRIFYSPEYSSDKQLHSRLPDFRDLLYWSPDINTNEKGEGNFSFYTGDIPGKYFVVLQGISANGNAGCTGIILNVEK